MALPNWWCSNSAVRTSMVISLPCSRRPGRHTSRDTSSVRASNHASRLILSMFRMGRLYRDRHPAHRESCRVLPEVLLIHYCCQPPHLEKAITRIQPASISLSTIVQLHPHRYHKDVYPVRCLFYRQFFSPLISSAVYP